MFKTLKKYTPFLRANLLTMFTYRASVISWFFVELSYFIMMIFLWLTIYSGRNQINGFTKEQMLFYFLIIGFIGLFTQTDAMYVFNDELRQGQISMYLIKPIDYKIRIFFGEVGRKVGIVSMLAPINILVIIILMSLFNITISLNYINVILFMIYIPLIFMFMFEFSYLFGLLSIYTTNAFGLAILANIIVQIASGGLIPLNFYPKAISNIVYHLPFQYINYYPTVVLLGKFDNDTVLKAAEGISILILWILVFKLINYLLFRINEKKIVIFGG